MANTTQSGEFLPGLSNREDFIKLYDKYAAAILGVITRIVGNAKMAEDVLQASFIEMWNSIRSYDPAKDKIFTWMLRIAKKLASEAASKWKDRAVESEATRAVPKNQLSESSQPVALNLIYLEGCSLSDVARRLNQAEDVVKRTVITAVKNLKQMIVA